MSNRSTLPTFIFGLGLVIRLGVCGSAGRAGGPDPSPTLIDWNRRWLCASPRLNHRLGAIFEPYTHLLLDKHLRAVEEVAHEHITVTAPLKGRERLAREFQEHLVCAIPERLLPKRFAEWICRGVEGAILAGCIDFVEDLTKGISDGVKLRGLGVNLGGVRISVSFGPALTAVLKSALASALRLAGQRLARHGLKRFIQLAVLLYRLASVRDHRISQSPRTVAIARPATPSLTARRSCEHE